MRRFGHRLGMSVLALTLTLFGAACGGGGGSSDGGGGSMFACGTSMCSSATQYCLDTMKADSSGNTTQTFTCVSLPSGCSGDFCKTCLASVPGLTGCGAALMTEYTVNATMTGSTPDGG